MLEKNIKDRLAIVSFYVPNVHYNLVVRLLNDKFGVQPRCGSCAGTYGHILLNVDHDTSNRITKKLTKVIMRKLWLGSCVVSPYNF
jgi:selenocysteine lyase/cysteine desulfurase